MYVSRRVIIIWDEVRGGEEEEEEEEVIIVIIFFSSSLASRVSHYKSGYTIENNNFCFFSKTRRFFLQRFY